MGGKGGGDTGVYNPPPDTSGYGTLDEAKATLAATAPLDLTQYQQQVDDVRSSANAASAPAPAVDASTTSSPPTIASSLGDAVLAPPNYWKGQLNPASVNRSSAVTTNT